MSTIRACERPSIGIAWVSLTRPHLVLVASLGALVFGWIFAARFDFVSALVCALDWFVVNLLNRFSDSQEDDGNALAVSRLTRSRTWSPSWSVVTVAALLAAGHAVTPELTLLRIAAHWLGFAYNQPLFPLAWRLKSVYLVKNLASATGFLLTSFGYPLCRAASQSATLRSDLSWEAVACLAAFFFLYELTFELLFDMRDQHGDRACGLRTLPSVHGRRAAWWTILCLNLAACTILVAGFGAGVVPWRMLVLAVGPVLTALEYWKLAGREVDERACVELTCATCLLLAAYLLWAALDLPGA